VPAQNRLMLCGQPGGREEADKQLALELAMKTIELHNALVARVGQRTWGPCRPSLNFERAGSELSYDYTVEFETIDTFDTSPEHSDCGEFGLGETPETGAETCKHTANH